LTIDDRRLRCPDCGGALGVERHALVCLSCGRAYPVEAGVAVLHPAALGEVERAEIAYWDQRGRAEATRLDEYYRENYVALDRWGMYAYLESVRQLDPATPILEIGAGMVPKSLYLDLYEGFHDVTVSDISPVQLTENRRLCEQLGVADRLMHVAADAASLPFADAAFAAVVVHSALHHVPATAAAVAEMARCVQPGGLLIVGHEPNRRLHRWVRRVADRLRLTERHREATYSVADEETPGLAASELIAQFRSAGVVPVAYEPHWYVMGIAHPLPLVVRRLARGWSPLLGAWLRSVARAVDAPLARVPGVRLQLLLFARGAETTDRIVSEPTAKAGSQHTDRYLPPAVSGPRWFTGSRRGLSGWRAWQRRPGPRPSLALWPGPGSGRR
jgi:ubiquinone/menaquinone biosynthesis C-methylase UbiE/uncharacterized protein YbaR (Trm112 family)